MDLIRTYAIEIVFAIELALAIGLMLLVITFRRAEIGRLHLGPTAISLLVIVAVVILIGLALWTVQ